MSPCDVLKGDGLTAIVCRGRGRTRICGVCKARPATKLCDHVKVNGKTCDYPMCALCATHVGPSLDIDYCPIHAGTR